MQATHPMTPVAGMRVRTAMHIPYASVNFLVASPSTIITQSSTSSSSLDSTSQQELPRKLDRDENIQTAHRINSLPGGSDA